MHSVSSASSIIFTAIVQRASESGFENLQAFTRLFSRTYGLSPGKFRADAGNKGAELHFSAGDEPTSANVNLSLSRWGGVGFSLGNACHRQTGVRQASISMIRISYPWSVADPSLVFPWRWTFRYPKGTRCKRSACHLSAYRALCSVIGQLSLAVSTLVAKLGARCT
ncbi:hypothetical protein IMCC3135_02625 [Granulosicoccus antarcticus IMCC3135]|uniref:HTH araC/xylS-type domain-containing protein n=1 Tax=Granulosicoccus antarcticus IMCC3135 TaxID=1192854 RepID=A0A2Z2NLH3_9GAMM|nr:hypothetical protein IMCC3135_02625 [Granulosicoccus antarcticus IMCC3135]